MNISPKRIPPGGPSVAARIMSALDAEFAPQSRYAFPGQQARGLSSTHAAGTSSPAPTRPVPFILQPREVSSPIVLRSSLPPSAPPVVSGADALRAIKRAQREREKAEYLLLPKYDCKKVPDGARPPAIVYSRDEEEIDDLAANLTGPLGFDMEWRPTYIRGRGENKVATIQICDSQTIIVAQVSALRKVPAALKKLIEDKDVVKCGLNIMGDGQKLLRDYGVLGQNLVDLGEMSKQADKGGHSGRTALSALVGKYLKHHLEKGPVRMSDWERYLTQDQIRYAANDAFCGLELYNVFLKMAKDKKVTLKPGPYTFTVKAPQRLADVTGTVAPARQPHQTQARRLFESRSITFETASVQDENSPVPSSSTSTCTSTSTSVTTSTTAKQSYVRPSHLRAYQLWRETNMGLDALCGALRSPINPLARTTVISYLVEAVRADTSLPFDAAVLADMVNMEPYTRKKYKAWVDRQRTA
ncbi:ribonuclease H-like protein [Auricularia subglabra TFB-10046 SS5]|nr:ribonuclease H-like protein [Auricularia subglabra TFB-10046 SS5]